MSVQKAPRREGKSLSNYWFLSLRLFAHIRSKAARKQRKPPVPAEETIDTEVDSAREENNSGEGMGVISQGHDGDIGTDRGWVSALQKSVKMIHFGGWEEKEAAAAEMARLAAEDLKRRRAMSELGVIPPLVAMVGSEVAARRGLAVRALVQLSDGSYTNKALMVEAGILSKLPNNIDDLDETSKRELAHLLSSLSSLAHSKFSLDSSKIVPSLVSILESSPWIETQKKCLTALHNLSSVLENIEILISNGIIDYIVNLLSVKEVSEKALLILANLVVILAGKRSIEQNPAVPGRFIEIITWEESPKCQELSTYILMVLAHHSHLQRRRMAEGGIVQVLLGVVLLGSPLARKRALKLLQWFKDERQMRVGPHSGPQVGRRAAVESPAGGRRGAEEEKGKGLMRRIVKESLYKNLVTITSRAMNGNDEALRLKALVGSSSSKSLPY